jgi:N-acetylmuramoyl-L-alanine amidase/beta-lactamase regulating signal transducer with metallopeptidase domain
MTDFLIKSTISLTVFLGFYHLVLGREKMHQFNRFYLLTSIAISFVIPFLTFEIIQIVPTVQTIEPVNTAINSSAIPENEIHGNNLLIEESINFTPYILWSLYGMIALLLLFRFGKNIWKLISKSTSNPNVKYKNAYLVLVEEETLPHTFLNSIFVNFEDYNNRNIEDELYTHELVHVTQKHTIDILFIEFLKVIFWFNPLFIFYKKAIQLNHEFLADEEIVKTYNNVLFYQSLLLQKSCGNQTIYLASNLNYLVTKKRLIMMTKSTPQKIAVLKKIAIVPILAGLIYFFCVEIVAQEKITTNENGAVAYATSKIEKPSKISVDDYFKGVRIKCYDKLIIVSDDKKNPRTIGAKYPKLLFNKKYEELTKSEKAAVESSLILSINDPLEKKSPSLQELKEFQNSKKFAIWIDGENVPNSKLNNYNAKDFAYYAGSIILKNARTKKHPQPFQYWFYTNTYFKENKMGEIKNKYPGDEIVIYNEGKNIMITPTEKSSVKAEVVSTKKIVVIDASHGGHDFGATKDELNEKNLTSEIAKKIKEMYSDKEIEIHFTRTSDKFMELKERTDFINSIKPDLVISLHINSNKNIDKNGFELFVSDKNELFEKSKIHAENLSVNLSKTQLKNGGLKTAPFWILKNSNSPSVVVELGYISNENDRKFISSEKGQTEIAKTLLEFISDINKN